MSLTVILPGNNIADKADGVQRRRVRTSISTCSALPFSSIWIKKDPHRMKDGTRRDARPMSLVS